MSSPQAFKIGVIVCSTRTPRVGPKIADFTLETILSQPTTTTKPYNLTLIDLADWDLPLFNEPTVPSRVSTAKPYMQPHTQAWSEYIKSYNAFIFVTPQYNWGYPAVLKNAIDYLYHEWKGKPAMIVSYGGHGGGKAATQLREVLSGLRMLVAETMPALALGHKDGMFAAMEEGSLLPETTEGWSKNRGVVVKAFGELQTLLEGVGRRKE